MKPLHRMGDRNQRGFGMKRLMSSSRLWVEHGRRAMGIQLGRLPLHSGLLEGVISRANPVLSAPPRCSQRMYCTSTPLGLYQPHGQRCGTGAYVSLAVRSPAERGEERGERS
jgi:hypothetical protein